MDKFEDGARATLPGSGAVSKFASAGAAIGLNCLLWLLRLQLRELSVLWPPWWAPADHDAPLTGALRQVPTRQTLPLALPCVSCAPSRYRSLSLNPRRARPPATTRAIQLAHIGIDQSPMMTVRSIKIRTRWNSATTAKITPAMRENVFASMRRHPRGRRLRTSSEQFGSLTLRVTSAAIPHEPGTTAYPHG
jgi:hypothetical protein